jgi:hypothetical protein
MEDFYRRSYRPFAPPAPMQTIQKSEIRNQKSALPRLRDLWLRFLEPSRAQCTELAWVWRSRLGTITALR